MSGFSRVLIGFWSCFGQVLVGFRSGFGRVMVGLWSGFGHVMVKFEANYTFNQITPIFTLKVKTEVLSLSWKEICVYSLGARAAE